jgi:hypothetical protein
VELEGLVFDNEWFHKQPENGEGKVFGVSRQYPKDLINGFANPPNHIKILVFNTVEI